MGLIKCPDCEKLFSDRISACPNCGCPIEEAVKEMQQGASHNEVCQSEEHKTSATVPPTQHTTKPKHLSKSAHNEKMTSAELKAFAFQSILPTISKELGEKISKIEQCNSSNSVDYYITLGAETIGLDVVVDIAPCFRHSICNWEHAEQMYKKGYKYAVAHIGVGSKDKLRREKRLVFKDDDYLFLYEKLNYFDYGKKANVQYSLSSMDYSFIYKDEATSDNPYTIQKTRQTYSTLYLDKAFIPAMNDYWNLYSLPQETMRFYLHFIDELAYAISYHLPPKEILLNFCYCVDFCKGLLLADSRKVSKRKVIPVCYELLDSNRSLNLSEHDKYTFAFFVYYYLENGEYNGELENGGYIKTLKVKLFEEKPAYFGFESLCQAKANKKRVNSAEYIFHMTEMIRNFIDEDFPEYISLNAKVNAESSRKFVDFSSYLAKFTQMAETVNKQYSFLVNNFDSQKSFYKKELYNAFMSTIQQYTELLRLDCKMFRKLTNKSSGGKYSFFEYRKDSKERELLLQKVVSLYNALRRTFSIKSISENTRAMVSIYSEFVNDLRNEYLNSVKGSSSNYAEFRVKLCDFHTLALTMPYEKEHEDERKLFIACIADFIELIEMHESPSTDEDSILDKEEDLLDSMEIIRDNIYRALI